MTPITDPRPLPAALSDWMARHGLSAYAAAPILGAHQSTVRRWIEGAPCDRERGLRAVMTLYDQGWRP